MVVTGAARGIGRAVLNAFTVEGARVVAVDIDSDPLEDAVNDCRNAAGEAVAWPGDVSRREDVRRAIQECARRFGRVDVMVQVAGVADFVPLLDDIDLLLLAVNPGYPGQTHLPNTAARVEQAQRLVEQTNHPILGGVTAKNAAAIATTGPDLIVAGRAVSTAPTTRGPTPQHHLPLKGGRV